MQNYENLEVYKETERIVLDIYQLTRNYPRDELFGIVQQMRRAALSVGANIAEGTGRKSNADFLRFLHNSMGSIKELQYFLRISFKLKYMSEDDFSKLDKKIYTLGCMLGNLIKTINSRISSNF